MKLIILNGPSGVGKSTVATRLHADLPKSVVADIDAIRRGLPAWRERREESLKEAHGLALEMIQKELGAGRDVIVDKLIRGTNTLDAIVDTGEKSGATVYEIVLTADKSTVMERAVKRGFSPDGLLTPQWVSEHWERIHELTPTRACAVVIDTTNLTPDEVYQKVKSLIN